MGESWSEQFRRHIEARGLTQQEATFELRRVRVRATQSQVHYWLHGSKPRDEAMRKRIERWSKGAVVSDAPSRARSGRDESGPLPVDATGTDD